MKREENMIDKEEGEGEGEKEEGKRGKERESEQEGKVREKDFQDTSELHYLGLPSPTSTNNRNYEHSTLL